MHCFSGIPTRASRGLRRGGRGGGHVGGGARGAEAAVRAAGDPAQQDAAPGQPAHQQAPRRAQAAAPTLLLAGTGLEGIQISLVTQSVSLRLCSKDNETQLGTAESLSLSLSDALFVSLFGRDRNVYEMVSL